MNIYRKINRRKIQFDFVVNESGKVYAFEPEIRELGGQIYRIPRYNIANHLIYKKCWNELIKAHPEWNIVHSHYITPSLAYLPVMKSYNLPVILHSHTSGSASAIKSQLQILLRFPARNSDIYCFACSQDAAKWMFGNKKSYIMKNAIDAAKFVYKPEVRKSMRKAFGLENSFVVGHTGRFEKVKNHTFLLDVFYSIQKKIDRAVLLLIGEGELKAEIQKKAMRLGINHKIIFTGVRSDVPALLQAMDVFVFPSLYEGLGIALIEAQAAGLPCYTSSGVVSKEAKITDLLTFLPLQTPAAFWAEEILAGKEKFFRINRYNDIITAGFDINDSINWIEHFYLKSIMNEPEVNELPYFTNELSRN